MVRVLGGRVLGGVGLRPARQVHQLGLGAQGQEVLLAHVPHLVSHVASSFMVQVNLRFNNLSPKNVQMPQNTLD